jgi:hypothetical protein
MVRGQGGDRTLHDLVSLDEENSLSFTTYMQEAEILEFFLFGNWSTTGSGPYTHTLATAQGPKSVTLEHHQVNQGSNADKTLTFLGCTGETLSITSEEDSFVEVEQEYFAASVPSVNNNSADSTSLLSDRPFKHSDLDTCSFNGNNIPVGSAAPRSIEAELVNNNTRVPEEGSNDDAEHVPGDLGIEVTITYNPNDVQFYSDWQNDTKGDLIFKWQRGSNDTFQVKVTGAEINEPPTEVAPDDVTEQEVTLTGSDMEIEVVNQSASYGLS